MFANSKLSRYKIRRIAECFCIDIDATKTALILKLNRKTANRYFLAFRLLIHAHQLSRKEHVLGLGGADENSSPARVQGTIKHPLFGIYERDGSVYTELITDPSAKTLRAVIRGRISSEDLVRSEGWKGYDGLVDVGYDKHFRLDKAAQIDIVEAFWSFTKRRLAKFNGTKRNFDLHLKECEWRYNRPLPKLLADLNRLMAKKKHLKV